MTALGVILVFFVLGLFKGLIWQVSRIVILVSAYFVAGQFGHDVAAMLGARPAPASPAGSVGDGTPAGPAENTVTTKVDTTLSLAYCLLFVAVLVVLSLLAIVIRKLAHKAGLGFFDRLGGGVLGVATGACIVLAGVFGVNMFFPQSELARAAGESHSMRLSQRAIELLGSSVNDDLRAVLHIEGSSGQPTTGAPNEGATPNPLAPTQFPMPSSGPTGTGGREAVAPKTGEAPSNRRRGR